MFLFQKVFYIISFCCSWYLWYMSALIHSLIKYNSLSMQKDYCYLYIWDEETRKRTKGSWLKAPEKPKFQLEYILLQSLLVYLLLTFFNSLATCLIWRGNVDYNIHKYK